MNQNIIQKIIVLEKKQIYELKEGTGFVKEINFKRDVIFEGNYLNGERWKGKEYGYNHSLIFDGEYLNEKEDVFLIININ